MVKEKSEVTKFHFKILPFLKLYRILKNRNFDKFRCTMKYRNILSSIEDHDFLIVFFLYPWYENKISHRNLWKKLLNRAFTVISLLLFIIVIIIAKINLEFSENIVIIFDLVTKIQSENLIQKCQLVPLENHTVILY